MAEVKKRPKVLDSITHHVQTGCGELDIRVGLLDDNPFEVFLHLGNQGGCGAAQTEAIGRAISVGLRAGIPVSEYVDHLSNIHCNCPTFEDGVQMRSCPDAISQVLKNFVKEEEA